MTRITQHIGPMLANYVAAALNGDWLLVPSSLVLAGAWIVWLVCGVGFYLLNPESRPGVSCSIGIGGLVASPFFGVAMLLRGICRGR